MTTLPLIKVPYNRKERRKRTAHHLPCVCFGSSQYRIARESCDDHKLRAPFNPKKQAQKSQQFRFGKPTIGETNLSHKQKKYDNSNQCTKTKNKELSLLLICQKVEHIRKTQNNERWCVKKPAAHFKFNIPGFPAREEFVFRNRYRHAFFKGTNMTFEKTLYLRKGNPLRTRKCNE